MIDTHCHLDVERFDADREAVLARAFEAGVKGLVVPAIGPGSWEPLLRWPEKDARVQVGLGIHPQLLPELDPAEDERQLQRLDELLSQGRAAAVGECGLDGPTPAMERQVRVLERHLELSRKHRLPVLLHCLRAHKELMALFKRVPFPEAGVIMHSYSGGADQVKHYANLGCHFSFAGPVTFADARRPLDAVRAVPAERLLLETDAPDQAPHPHRGQRSEPAYLPLICAAMAKARGLAPDALAALTTANAARLFAAFR